MRGRAHQNGVLIKLHQKQQNQWVNQCHRPEVQEKKRPILIRQLQNQLKKLDECEDEDFTQSQDPYSNDAILDRLQLIAKESVRYDLKEIERLCKLGIGKRILNIELKKKKDEHLMKLKKKEKIELFFRQNRIKRYNYDSLIDKKLKDNTLIAKAYQNGKGFIQSTTKYQDEQYDKALDQCSYINTIKEVNKIFYANYSSIPKREWNFIDTLLKIVWIPIIIFVFLSISLPFKSFDYEEVVIMVLFGIIIFILMLISVKTFINRPNNNNQIEQTVQDVQVYFEKINTKYQEKSKNIEWICSKDFMYLEVVFHDGFPT